jgi:cellulose synthase/poly-beta-1,6-N-acetylglucosamine synthase-like glycosyltransferase
MPSKNLALVAVVGLSWLLLSAISFGSFEGTIPRECSTATHLALLSFYGWFMIFWLWALNTFWHQVFSFFARSTTPAPGAAHPDARVAILYTTCDDFDPQACGSCLQQTHPHTRLIICDDSFTPRSRQMIDRWAQAQSDRVTVVRRGDNRGFKAGNLNHAIAQHAKEEYLLICDADEIIPPDFVERLLPYFSNDGVGFVQANHRARTVPQTQFAASLALTTDIFFGYFLPPKNRFGFVACQGHGVIIRRSVWAAIGGFPEIVCEDLGFSSRALAQGYRGIFVPSVVAQEATPPTYRALLGSRSRVVRGTIEYFQTEYPQLLRSPHASPVEKLDILMSSSCCYLGLVVVINIWGGLVLSHLHGVQGYSESQPWLPFVYVLAPIATVAPLIVEIIRQPIRYGQYLFVTTTNHASLMPILAVRALEQTLRLRAPIFHVTGKIARQGHSLGDYLVSIPWGLSVLAGALLLPSPVAPLILGASLTFLLTPLLYFSESKGVMGVLGRQWGLAPYVAIVVLGVWIPK